MTAINAGPGISWVDVKAEVLAWQDKGRKDWTGHTIKMENDLGTSYAVVDRVEDRGDGIWRLHLIDTDSDK